jgi:signal peptidase I
MNEVYHWQNNGYKFTVSGPAIGGKIRINFDPNDLKKRRFTTLVQSSISIIKSYYGTGGDLNVDEIHEVIP